MSAPPPPPPPSFDIGNSAASYDSGKSLLLQSIRNGKQLKKTVTIDKSAPCIAGKVRNGNINGGNNNNSNNNSSPTPLTKNIINNNGNGSSPINLGGLFAGGMPKLKPTGLRSTIVDKESSPSPPSTGNLSSYSHTIKRGPPPVPPPATQKPQIINEINVNESLKGFGKPMLAPKPPAPSITTTTTITPPPPPPPIATSTTTTSSPLPPPPPPSTTTTLSTPPSKPYPPPKNLDVIRGGSVSRAQSMRLPRSPPVLAPSPSSLHQSQDFLNETQHRLTNRILKPPVVRPPSPPISRSSSSSTTRSAPPPPTRVAVPTMPPPPPPPPHRSNAGHQRHAPPPPTRNLSLVNDQTNNQTSYITNDFEQRFVKLFHSISTFPNPEQFRGVPKLYNSKNAAKQQAPAPPPPQQQQQQSSTSSSSMIQLTASSGVKQWQHNAASSAC